MTENTIVLASNNPGKAAELDTMLKPLGWKVIPQSQFKLDSVAETGLTFVENAIIKARYACEHTGLPAIADDSGLEIDALNGQPGIYSARFSGENANDESNNARVLELLQGVAAEDRSARFQCALVMLRHATDPTPLICCGTWEGFILDAPQGDNGFGYDPLFYVPGEGCTSAQLPSDLKNRISHRAKALQALLQKLNAPC